MVPVKENGASQQINLFVIFLHHNNWIIRFSGFHFLPPKKFLTVVEQRKITGANERN